MSYEFNPTPTPTPTPLPDESLWEKTLRENKEKENNQ